MKDTNLGLWVLWAGLIAYAAVGIYAACGLVEVVLFLLNLR